MAAWLFVFGDVVLIIWSGSGMPSLQTMATLLLIFVLPLIVMALVPVPSKRVRMSDLGIYVSDNTHESFVPFSAIQSASWERSGESSFIEVMFGVKTVFGDSIQFTPRARFGFLPWSDPAVREFLQRANSR